MQRRRFLASVASVSIVPGMSFAQGKPLRMNFGALISAFGADFGFTPREYCLLLSPIFLAGMQPCYLEALDKPPGAVFPTPCEGVAYEGTAPRDWPGAAR